jgi:hypothetical protein
MMSRRRRRKMATTIQVSKELPNDAFLASQINVLSSSSSIPPVSGGENEKGRRRLGEQECASFLHRFRM